MHGAHDAARGNLCNHVSQAVPGFSRRGSVIYGQQDPGEHLQQKGEERDAAENLMPSGRRRDVFVEEVAKIALAVGDDIEKIKAAPFPGTGRSVADELTHLVATIGENMTIRRAKVLSVPSGEVATYVHQALKPGLGKIGVIVATAGQPGEALNLLGRQVGMHVAASRPDALDISSVSPEALEREKAVLTEQARASGRPDNVIEKMVQGRVQKFYEEVALLEQVWVHDNKTRVKDVMKNADASITGFERFALGEGIDKPKEDFAAEVAATRGPNPAAE